MTKLVCAACGYEPDWDRREWGRNPETHGHGPDPVCPRLVDDPRFPPLPDGQKPQMSCHGTLVPKQVRRGEA